MREVSIMKYYNARGVVIGNLWGSGKGMYPSREFNNYMKKSNLYDDIKKALADGSLDSGMGYESLIGSYMIIEEVAILVYKGKHFVSRDYNNRFFGDLKKSEKEHLKTSYNNMI